MTDLPPEAITAALAARANALIDRPTPTVLSDEALMRITLEAAAPVIAAAERDAIQQLARDCGATGRGANGPAEPFADLIDRYR